MSAFLRLATAILPILAAAGLGSIVTRANIPTWYAGLRKPGFTPPDWIFGPVWTTLYALMAFAAWRILRVPSDAPGRLPALIAFFVQLCLNAAWSFGFFGLHSPATGLAIIVALVVALIATIVLFRRLDPVAAWCLAPYLAWVSYAAVLNAAIWRLNP